MKTKSLFGNWPYQKPETTEIYNLSIKYPRISIITPSYNQGSYIEETILSVIQQNYPNLQYIIIDGGSTDETNSIIKKYEKHIDYFISEKDSGQSEAINKGHAIANGEIINWLCSDDILLPGALHTIAKAFLENPKTNVVTGISRQFSEDKDYGLSTTTLHKEFHLLLYTAHICQPATWFRKEIFDQITPLNTKLHYTMDSEMWMNYLIKYQTEYIHYLPIVLNGYRYHDLSKSISQDYQFGIDKTGLVYSILHLLNAPKFLLQLYYPHSKSEMHKKLDLSKELNKDQIRKILIYYTLKSITFSKIKKQSFTTIKSIIYYILLNPVMSISEYKALIKEHIAPKYFKEK